jgi:hypothetical protein
MPIADDPSHQAALWSSASGMVAAHTKLPPRKSVVGLSSNLRCWAHILDHPIQYDPAALPLFRIARIVSEAETTA